jgi:hypothetical protein
MRHTVLLVIALCATASICAETKQAQTISAQAAFKKMMTLEGEWEGKDADGNPVHTSFKRVISGTAVMETLAPCGMEEMLSLFSVDKDGIQLAHYCPTNNQPRMRAVPSSADAQELDFQFTGAGNLPDSSAGHQHRMVLHFEDADHITENWTWRHGNHDMPMVFHLARKH